MPLVEHAGKFLIADALKAYSENFRLLSSDNPYLFSLNGQTYSAHVSETHFAARDNRDEYRIQIPRVVRETQRRRMGTGTRPVFLGYLQERGGFFTGWEPAYAFSLRAQDVGSVYVPRSKVLRAASEFATIDFRRAGNLRRDTSKISFRPDFLGFYLENLEALHAALTKDELIGAFDRLASVLESEEFTGTSVSEVELGGQRRLVSSTRTGFARDPKFKFAVLAAYGGACCICELQLGLVQAAHIIPHSHNDCVEDVINGLALCVAHHKLYDDALLLPSSQSHLILNQERVEHLQNIGQDSGLTGIRRLAAQQYRVPDHEPSRPDDGFLERGVRIRLGTDT